VAPISRSHCSSGSGGEDGCAGSDTPVYYSQLFVRRDSGLSELNQLQGHTFAYNDGASLSGYHCLRFFLQSYCSSNNNNCSSSGNSRSSIDDEGPSSDADGGRPLRLPFFSRIIPTGGHLHSLRAVSSGLADVCCCDCEVLDRLQKASATDPDLAALLDSLQPVSLPSSGDGSGDNGSDGASLLGPNPAQPVVASVRLSVELRRRIAAAFLAVAQREREEAEEAGGTDAPPSVLEAINATAYTAVSAGFYGGIRGAMCAGQGRDILCARESELVAEAGGDNCFRHA
jgi:ABC-type phosphate/phosphonate transport system substrate-binding protein